MEDKRVELERLEREYNEIEDGTACAHIYKELNVVKGKIDQLKDTRGGRLEVAVHGALSRGGIEARLVGTEDGGRVSDVNVWLGGLQLLVQCKNWNGKKPGVNEFKEAQAANERTGAAGTYILSSQAEKLTENATATRVVMGGKSNWMQGLMLLALRTKAQESSVIPSGLDELAKCMNDMFMMVVHPRASMMWQKKTYEDMVVNAKNSLTDLNSILGDVVHGPSSFKVLKKNIDVNTWWKRDIPTTDRALPCTCTMPKKQKKR